MRKGCPLYKYNCFSQSTNSPSPVLPLYGGVWKTRVWLILEEVHILGRGGLGPEVFCTRQGGTCVILYL